jgi:hypothetical protein
MDSIFLIRLNKTIILFLGKSAFHTSNPCFLGVYTVKVRFPGPKAVWLSRGKEAVDQEFISESRPAGGMPGRDPSLHTI